jgi:hypothetical protein
VVTAVIVVTAVMIAVTLGGMTARLPTLSMVW